MKILAVSPAYNEQASISFVIESIRKNHSEIDILVINDCSIDNTSEIVKKAGVKVIDLTNNLGIGGAVQTGYKYAFENNYDFVIQIDGDGQHNPEYIKNILMPVLNDDCDICIGSRFLTVDKDGFRSSSMRRLGIKILCAVISKKIKQKITDPTSGFRAANRKVIELFANNYPDDYPEPESLVLLRLSKLRILETPVVMNERRGGVSSISFFDSIYYMIKVVLAILLHNKKNGKKNGDASIFFPQFPCFWLENVNKSEKSAKK